MSRSSGAGIVRGSPAIPYVPPAALKEAPAMLTAEENAQLTRVGPGTLIGDLMRQYWIPVVESSEVVAGGRPKRVRILGEDLVVFRSPAGGAGLLSEFCAHRRASLYFARNEARGLRCVYHGWQFEAGGRWCPRTSGSFRSSGRAATTCKRSRAAWIPLTSRSCTASWIPVTRGPGAS